MYYIDMIDKINEIIEPYIAKDIKDKYSLVKIAKGYSATLYANSLINIDTSLKTVYRIMFKNNDGSFDSDFVNQ